MANLWQALEDSKGVSAVLVEWQHRVGPDFPTFKETFLQQTTRRAGVFPCPLGCGCSHEVHPRPDGSLVGVCQCEENMGCDDIPLTAEDVIVWELNQARLGRAIARAFDGCNVMEGGFGIPGAVQVGAFASSAMPMVLMIQDKQADFESAVAQLVVRLPKPFILLAPTNKFFNGNVQGMLKGAKAGFFDLESHVTLTPGGNLRANRTGGELFSSYLPEQQNTARKAEAERILGIFRQLGGSPTTEKASLDAVFRLIVLEDCTQREAARRCDCVPSLITKRVDAIEAAFGISIKQLKNFASDVSDWQTSVKGDRLAKRKHGARPDAFEPEADDGGEEGEDDG